MAKYSNKKNHIGAKRAQFRIAILALLLLASFIIIALRYSWVQTVQHDQLLARVEYQARERYTIHLPRGTIYDRNKRELAISNMTDSLFVDPNHVKDPDKLASDLAPVINMSKQEILKRISYGGGFVWLKRQMEPDMSKAVHKLIAKNSYTDCLGFRQESKRYYPNNILAANILGFVGTDDNGLDGIEQSMDKVIRGQIIKKSLFTDAFARPILGSVLKNMIPTDSSECKNVVLTLDSTIQFITEQALDKAMSKYAPTSATAIVMNPKTGEILAMASRPSYDPNNFSKYPAANWKNKAISFIYEPGSTFKAVVAAAALQEKVVRPNDIFVDPGYLMVNGRRIQNWSGGSFGTVTFTKVIEESINTGFVHVGLQLGGERLMKYARLFGFGKKTGIDLPGEEQGILFDPKNMSDINIATSSIGQSIAVTPLQIVTAMSAIANNGLLMQPHIVKTIYNMDGSIYEEKKPHPVHQTIDVSTDKTLQLLLEKVVSEGGGNKASVPGYRIAGKTGTAQKLDPVHGGYLPGHYIGSFCGFAPVNDPQFVVLVIIDDPTKINYYGGQIAAPIAHDIFSAIFHYRHLKPTISVKNDVDTENTVPAPTPPTALPVQENIPKGMTVIPDLIGKTIREATELLAKYHLQINIAGSGICDSQSPNANTLIKENSKINVHFSP